MSNYTLDQKAVFDTMKAVNTTANVQRKSHTSIPEDSIMKRLMDFAFSIPDFRRTGKGNHRHELGDIIMLTILARMSRCVGRADMIEFGKHNLRKFQSMGILKHGVPSEPTLCRIENGIDELGFASRMADFSTSFTKELVKAGDRLEIICVDGKAKGVAELMRHVSTSLSKLLRFLSQK